MIAGVVHLAGNPRDDKQRCLICGILLAMNGGVEWTDGVVDWIPEGSNVTIQNNQLFIGAGGLRCSEIQYEREAKT